MATQTAKGTKMFMFNDSSLNELCNERSLGAKCQWLNREHLPTLCVKALDRASHYVRPYVNTVLAVKSLGRFHLDQIK